MIPSIDYFKAIVSKTYGIVDIDYDIDLDGETVNLGNQTTLNFVGGSIKNGTLVGSGSVLRGRIQLNNVTLSGSFYNFGSTRPTGSLLYKGRMFFDEALNPARPIWYNGTAWVDATGATV